MQSILVSSGYHPTTLTALRKQFHVIDITSQKQALTYLRATSEKPAAMSIGYATKHPGLEDLAAREMLEGILKVDPNMPVVISTSTNDPAMIVDLVKRGAFDYVVEPRDRNEPNIAAYTQNLTHALTQAVQWRQVTEENQRLREDLIRQQAPELLRGKSSAITEVIELLRKVAPTQAHVLITGEPGSGRQLAAQNIHDQSPRHEEPFVRFDCASMREDPLEERLFGLFAERDAKDENEQPFLVIEPSLLRQAGHGTLYLANINALPTRLQSKLFDAIETGSTSPVDSSLTYPVNCRLIAGSETDLSTLVRQSRFREDLYYLLATFRIHILPLRQRREDIPGLISYLLQFACDEFYKEIEGIEPAALSILENHDWPGNVRQLQSEIERAVIACETDRLRVSDLDKSVREESPQTAPANSDNYHEAMQAFEAQLIKQALRRAGGNLSEVARQLNIKRTTLAYRAKQLGLT